MRRYKKRKITTKSTTTRRKQFNLILQKELWIKGSQQIKEYRENNQTNTCPISEMKYGEGLDQCVLDHDHQSGLVRQPINSRSNLFLGRIELYYRKLFGKTDVELLTLLKNLVEYLEQSGNQLPKLHGEIIEVEKRRVSKYKIETLKKKLDLPEESEYTKHELTEMWLQKFIEQKEIFINQFIKEKENK